MSASARALLLGKFPPRACESDVSTARVKCDQLERFSRLVDFVVVYLVGYVSSFY